MLLRIIERFLSRRKLSVMSHHHCVSVGSSKRLLQGADGRYSDNDQLRSYYK